MAVKDSPDTWIKAADARTIFNTSDPLHRLNLMGDVRGFVALSAIRFIGREPGMTLTWGRTPADQDVMDTYAKNIAGRAGADVRAMTGAVLLGIRNDGNADVATWGKTVQDCARLGEWGGTILHDLPVCPFQTWMGWGNGGIPKRMDASRVATLTPNQQAYVGRYTHPDAR
jgi:hypothetical protein